MGRIPSRKRLGVYQNPLAPRGQTRYFYNDPIADARHGFLVRLGRLDERILTDLRKIGRVDVADEAARLQAWAQRWHLTDPWVRDYARATVALYRRFDTEPGTLAWSDADGRGACVWEGDPSPDPIVLDPRHLDWLAAYHLSPAFATVARTVGVTRDGARKGIMHAAAVLGLTLRLPKRGNPTFGAKPTTTKRRDTRGASVRRLLRDLGR